MKKRILSTLIALCMVLTLLPATALAADASNTAKSDYFIGEFQSDEIYGSGWRAISNVEDLKSINNNLKGMYYLTGDIDLSGKEWTPIGTESNPFTGCLAGRGYAIKNLTITGRNGGSNFGLFGVAKDATFTDLGLENVSIKVDSDSPRGGITAVGGLVGCAKNSAGESTRIMNCYVTGEVSFNSSGESSGYVGGLVGRSSLERGNNMNEPSLMIQASYNRAKVTGSGMSCQVFAGGLLGYAGASRGGLLNIQKSFNAGDVTAHATNTSSMAGGLLGSNNASSLIWLSYNSGDVYANGGKGLQHPYRSSFVAGGLAGENGNGLTISECYNYGDVMAQNTIATENCDVFAGGLLGEGTYMTGIDKCYAAGSVSAEGNYGEVRSGGLAGVIHAVEEGNTNQVLAYLTNSFVMSRDVTASGRADVTEAALVYTTDEHERRQVDNGSGMLVWEDATMDSVKTNSTLGLEGCGGNAEDNTQGKITQEQAGTLSTYTQRGWNGSFWKIVKDCPYPQLFFQTETLGYTGNSSPVELGGSVTIDKTSPKLGDKLTADTTDLTVTPDTAELGKLSYQWYRDGDAISGANAKEYQTVAEDVGHTIKVEVTAAGCVGSVTSAATNPVGKGIFTGTAELTQTIRVGAAGSVKVDLSKLVPGAQNAQYTIAKTVDTDGILNGAATIEGATLTVAYNQVDTADKQAVITLTITSDTYEQIEATVTIRSANKDALPAEDIVLADAKATYDGQPHAIGAASVTGEYNGGEFTFTYQYTKDGYDKAEAPTDAGAYTVTVTAENGDYVGTKTATLTILPKALSKEMLSIAGVTYTGSAQTPVLTAKDGEKNLVQDTDYTVTLTPETNAATYPVEVTGKGNYTGTVAVDFVIAPKDISGAVVTLSRDGFVHTGSPIEPEIASVTVDNLTLTENDYTVSYANNTAVGTGTVTVTGKGNFAGTAEKNFTITDAEYYFSIEAPKTMVVGQTADASATLKGLAAAVKHDHALIKVTVTAPEGANPKVMATDSAGKEYNLAETGQWGPAEGFTVQADYEATTLLKLTFDQSGTYTAAFQLVDLDNENAVLGSGSCTIVVSDAYQFVITAPDTMRPNETAEASATLKGDANAPTYEHALIKVTVTAPEGAKPKILATDSAGKEYNLAETGQWGPDSGFTVQANYNVTTPLKLIFDQTGTYKAAFQLVDVDTNKVLGSGEKTIEVRKPSSGGGSGSSTYAITVKDSANGDVTSSHKNASSGRLVTITVEPDKGYALDELTVVDKKGNALKLTKKGDNQYTFSMPASAVTVEASFVREEEDVKLPFADVHPEDWFYDAVEYAYDHQLIKGVSDTAFAPKTEVTRGMMITMLYRMEKEPAVNGTSAFPDVKKGAWYADAVLWGAENGLVKGYDDGAFHPGDSITREQVAAMVYRYAELKGWAAEADGDLQIFVDGDKVSAWAEQAMSWAVGAELISGKGNSVLDPTGTATRAEVAQILMDFCETIVQ